jgi:hypothetical protein
MNAIIAMKGWRAEVKGTGSFLSSTRALMAPFIGPLLDRRKVYCLPMCGKHTGSNVRIV